VDLQLRADHPWLELICSIDWRQTHELLRLELPLKTTAVRWAADTSGAVLERPAQALTAREQARWEVPVISWFASQAAAPAGGLAVLLDGPQGVDVQPHRLGVSLLRGPTWPDPSADRGRHRLRLALMPLPSGWAEDAVPQAAVAFREPGWWGPVGAMPTVRSFLPALPDALVPIRVSRAQDSGAVLLQVLNPGATRVRWTLVDGAAWQMRRVDAGDFTRELVLRPGELADLELLPPPQSS
jgi:Alpha-mannosidase